jgi:hypothetical protein
MEIPTKEQYDDYKAQNLRAQYQVEMPALLKQLDLAEAAVLKESSWMSLDTSTLTQDELFSRIDQRIEVREPNKGLQTFKTLLEQAHDI